MSNNVMVESAGPTESQVADAMKSMWSGNPTETVAPAPTAEPEATVAASETSVAAEQAVAEQAPAEESEDIGTLKARLESTLKDYEALQMKSSSSLDWSRNLALRSASEKDRLRKVLTEMVGGKQFTGDELQAVLGGDVSPATQPIAVAPQPFASSPFFPTPAPPDEMAVLDANQFQIDRRMNDAEAEKFMGWVQENGPSLSPRSFVPGNTYATLGLLHAQYSAAQGPSPVTVQAAQSVARTQRAVAKAASGVIAKPKAAAPPDVPVDIFEQIKKDPEAFEKSGGVHELFKQLAANR